MPDNGATRTTVVETVRYEGGNLYEVIRQIVSERRTGRMTINFSQGGIGSLEWCGTGAKHFSLDITAPTSVACFLGK